MFCFVCFVCFRLNQSCAFFSIQQVTFVFLYQHVTRDGHFWKKKTQHQNRSSVTKINSCEDLGRRRCALDRPFLKEKSRRGCFFPEIGGGNSTIFHPAFLGQCSNLTFFFIFQMGWRKNRQTSIGVVVFLVEYFYPILSMRSIVKGCHPFVEV